MTLIALKMRSWFPLYQQGSHCRPLCVSKRSLVPNWLDVNQYAFPTRIWLIINVLGFCLWKNASSSAAFFRGERDHQARPSLHRTVLHPYRTQLKCDANIWASFCRLLNFLSSTDYETSVISVQKLTFTRRAEKSKFDALFLLQFLGLYYMIVLNYIIIALDIWATQLPVWVWHLQHLHPSQSVETTLSCLSCFAHIWFSTLPSIAMLNFSIMGYMSFLRDMLLSRIVGVHWP